MKRTTKKVNDDQGDAGKNVTTEEEELAQVVGGIIDTNTRQLGGTLPSSPLRVNRDLKG